MNLNYIAVRILNQISWTFAKLISLFSSHCALCTLGCFTEIAKPPNSQCVTVCYRIYAMTKTLFSWSNLQFPYPDYYSIVLL